MRGANSGNLPAGHLPTGHLPMGHWFETVLDELRTLPVFEGLGESILEWVAAHAEPLDLAPGDLLFEAGDPAEAMNILLEGELQFHFEISGQLVPIAIQERGEVGGLLPYSRMTEYTGRAVTLEPTRCLRIHKDHFPDMLHRSPELGQRLVAIMSDRVRRATRAEQQREKMMALGKLSAGLAHELNNPAAAVRSTVDELQQRLERLPEWVARMMEHGLTPDQVRRAGVLQKPRGEPLPLSSLERGEREDEVGDWLEEHGIEDGWRLAETLVEEGLGVACLEQLSSELPAEALPDVLVWMEGGLAARRLLEDVSAATGRISELVAAIKQYSHMDRAPDKQLTDVPAGLEATLTMLGHKLKRNGIEVRRTYAPDLPRIPAFPGELNQVWTNLIDNAIDAMLQPSRDEHGRPEAPTPKLVASRLDISADVRSDCVRVCIVDNGPGVPEDIQSRIFEPFFTTKAVGAGTGLGLDIVRRIVHDQHGGSVEIDSAPGRTAFSVWLPLAATDAGATQAPEEGA